MRILIVGGSGYLGSQLVHCATMGGHQVACTYLSRPPRAPEAEALHLDIRNQRRTKDVVDRLQPELVINAAFQQGDWVSTAVGPANLAEVLADHRIRLVHVSSDAVFSGSAIRYDETAQPDPITPYGAAKAAAETAVAEIHPSALVVRTSLIIGHGGSSHERMVHDLATGQQSGTLFTDDVRCPVHVDDLAAALLELGTSHRSGIHHAAGAQAISRHELGTLIARRDGLSPAALPAGRRAEANIPGPLDVRLDSTHTQQFLRTRLRGATEFLDPQD
ncbi:SDR family oxidoreductase [Parenemella sanctibonifatiensis]|uniref:dTDP-4-dehydrorhamnose reductase n=1 Tax=Parenemella sanctibonifatiensis TaxID=2016505 RepID=A0A255ESW2_9ACTN|nr:sugar nucleotide-binding protein [Parenemella sanctibonifatiensis]OYN91213.1 dTDP-4-dehydrorhamnose reductase [Parenemella sanctibonifatiensis]